MKRALAIPIQAFIDRVEDSALAHRLRGHRVRHRYGVKCLDCHRRVDEKITVGMSYRTKILEKHGKDILDLTERTVHILNATGIDDRAFGFGARGGFRQAADLLARLPHDVATRIRRATGPCPPRPGYDPNHLFIGALIYFVWGDFNAERPIMIYLIDDENCLEYARHLFDPSKGLVYTDPHSARFAQAVRLMTPDDVRTL